MRHIRICIPCKCLFVDLFSSYGRYSTSIDHAVHSTMMKYLNVLLISERWPRTPCQVLKSPLHPLALGGSVSFFSSCATCSSSFLSIFQIGPRELARMTRPLITDPISYLGSLTRPNSTIKKLERGFWTTSTFITTLVQIRELYMVLLHSSLHLINLAKRSANDAAAKATRLRMSRSLWDPTYVDESYIGTQNPPFNSQPNPFAVTLIPRMHALIDKHYPGTKVRVFFHLLRISMRLIDGCLK